MGSEKEAVWEDWNINITGWERCFSYCPALYIHHFVIIDRFDLVRDSYSMGIKFSKSRIDMDVKDAALGELVSASEDWIWKLDVKK